MVDQCESIRLIKVLRAIFPLYKQQSQQRLFLLNSHQYKLYSSIKFILELSDGKISISSLLVYIEIIFPKSTRGSIRVSALQWANTKKMQFPNMCSGYVCFTVTLSEVNELEVRTTPFCLISTRLLPIGPLTVPFREA